MKKQPETGDKDKSKLEEMITEERAESVQKDADRKARKEAGKPRPRWLVWIILSLVLLAAVIFLFIRSGSKTHPGSNPEHEFLALQEESGEDAGDVSGDMQGRPLDYILYDIQTGDDDYYYYGLFLFEDGTVWSGECGDEMLWEMDFFNIYWRRSVYEDAVFENKFSNWNYRGRLYAEDLEILIGEQKNISSHSKEYDWLDEYYGEQPAYGGLPVDKVDINEYHQFHWGVVYIAGDRYYYCAAFHASTARVYYLDYDEHSWFVVQNIKNSGFYKDWMQECFGDDWQRLEEFKDPDEVYESQMTQCWDYYQSRMEELGYN